MKKRKHIKWLATGGVLVLVGLTVFLNRAWINDWWRGMAYQPSAEMMRIREELGLTERAKFLFNAVQPELNDREDFNAKCRSELDTEMAVLGCYRDGNVYVFDITDDELAGIRELTTGHELLHAVWARMDDSEKEKLGPVLNQVFEANRDLLEEELSEYGSNEKQEELYVRVGTEIKNLPAELEQHYAGIFENQDKIVDFYESYIGVFREIKTEMEGLMAEIEQLKVEIETKTSEYESRLGQLNAKITSFNSCAEVSGCFKSEGEFNARRRTLVVEQEALMSMYNELNSLVSEYNGLVEKYNADVMHAQKLNSIVNSSDKPGAVE